MTMMASETDRTALGPDLVRVYEGRENYVGSRDKQARMAEVLLALLQVELPVVYWPFRANMLRGEQPRLEGLISRSDQAKGLESDERATRAALEIWAEFLQAPIRCERSRSDTWTKLSVEGTFHGMPVEIWANVEEDERAPVPLVAPPPEGAPVVVAAAKPCGAPRGCTS